MILTLAAMLTLAEIRRLQEVGVMKKPLPFRSILMELKILNLAKFSELDL
jgi:hypothetical protein